MTEARLKIPRIIGGQKEYDLKIKVFMYRCEFWQREYLLHWREWEICLAVFDVWKVC